MSLELKVVGTPEKDLAFTNLVYLHVNDFGNLLNAKIKNTKPPHSIPNVQEIQTHGLLVDVGGVAVFSAKISDKLEPGVIALNALQRKFLNSAFDKTWFVKPFTPPDQKYYLASLTLEVSLISKNVDPKRPIEFDAKPLQAEVKEKYGKQLFQVNQTFAMFYQNTHQIMFRVAELTHALVSKNNNNNNSEEESTSSNANESKQTKSMFSQGLGSLSDPESLANVRGLLLSTTDILFTKAPNSVGFQLTGQASTRGVSKILDVDFEKLGIGGLGNEFSIIFRRAFASRIFPTDVVKNMGINHVRGLMLYGPPGCGKTLIARQISKVLQGNDPNKKTPEPKIVNGPEILNKFVGGTEENIRALFKEAEEDQLMFGDESELHVIIMDEIDAIAKARGSTRDGTGVHDSLVNQLLSKIDGVNALNNILLIGMTNRLDTLDPALMRPGRFEVQVEIGLPDENGRLQILNIHTSRMKKAGYMSPDFDLGTIASRTKNFTGAEIEGLVKNAAGYAFQRQIDLKSSGSKVINPESVKIQMDDFDRALLECKPAFGVAENDELKSLYASGIIDYSEEFVKLARTLADVAKQVRTSERVQLSLVSVLLSGKGGSGKTALAARLAYESEFPFVRIVAPDTFIGVSEQTKCSRLAQVFDEAYRSSASLIVLEDVERLLDFSSVGPRFSNLVLQTLLILLKKAPPKGRRLMIVGMTSCEDDLRMLDVAQSFNLIMHVPQVENASQLMRVLQYLYNSEDSQASNQDPESGFMSKELMHEIAENCDFPISIKKLLLVLEMATPDKNTPITLDSFQEALKSAM